MIWWEQEFCKYQGKGMIGSAHPRGTCIAVLYNSDVMQTEIFYLWDGLVLVHSNGGSAFIKKNIVLDPDPAFPKTLDPDPKSRETQNGALRK
jgi:hypothetical protein